MANLKLAVCSLLFLTTTACGLALPKQSLARPEPEQNVLSSLDGKASAVDGSTVDFSKDHDVNQIVMFVSETCSVCRHETKGLVAKLNTTGAPTNVRFYSVLVGSVIDDARDWKSDLNVSWTVAIDDGDALFRHYCPALQTPCVLIKKPASQEFSRLYGEHAIEEWQQITGTWSY
jgi:hypothetical protein